MKKTLFICIYQKKAVILHPNHEAQIALRKLREIKQTEYE
jgi:hypothetical protein